MLLFTPSPQFVVYVGHNGGLDQVEGECRACRMKRELVPTSGMFRSRQNVKVLWQSDVTLKVLAGQSTPAASEVPIVNINSLVCSSHNARIWSLELQVCASNVI